MTEPYRAELLLGGDLRLPALTTDPAVTVSDTLESQRAELARIRPSVEAGLLAEADRWAWYPWRRTLVRVLGPQGFRRLRLDRNRNKLTSDEQDRLAALSVGVIGLSVGHAIAHTLALEGLCGRLRLADFDTIELSNLNRIPATVLDLGVNKAVVAARRIAELDPYLEVEIAPAGVAPETVDEFVAGLDVLLEECDSLDVKLLVREAAKRQRVPVIMETSDRGLLDVERFDLDPTLPIFHGLLGDLAATDLAGLSTRDKVPHVLRILEAGELSAVMAASMAEIDHQVTTWPQLGGDVILGAASAAAAVRRFGRGRPLPSGRTRVDLDEVFERLVVPAVTTAPADAHPEVAARLPPGCDDAIPAAWRGPLAAAVRAPSGGNAQPWWFGFEPAPDGGAIPTLVAGVRPDRRSRMDVDGRASLLALGAALFNARAAAAAEGAATTVELTPVAAGVGHVQARVALRPGAEPEHGLENVLPALLARHVNRQPGDGQPLDAPTRAAVTHTAEAAGGVVSLLEGPAVAAAADLLGRSDRIRFLNPDLHREMFAELRFPGDPEPNWGIEVSALELDRADAAKLGVSRRPDVMALLASWGGGTALGDMARERVTTSAAVAILATPATGPADYLAAGETVQRFWIGAEAAGLAVHPWSPVFLFARTPEDRRALVGGDPALGAEVDEVAAAFWELAKLPSGCAPIFVVRLSRADPASTVSRREHPHLRVPRMASSGLI
jgi:hypothetical protein